MSKKIEKMNFMWFYHYFQKKHNWKPLKISQGYNVFGATRDLIVDIGEDKPLSCFFSKYF